MEILPPTNRVEQSLSWDAKRSSAHQEILRVLWNQKFHYRIHKCPPPVSILSSINLVHSSPCYFLKIHFNIIFSSTPRPSKWSPSFGTPHQNHVCTTPFPKILHALSIILFLIWEPEQHFMGGTEHKAPRYVVFSNYLSPHPSGKFTSQRT